MHGIEGNIVLQDKIYFMSRSGEDEAPDCIWEGGDDSFKTKRSKGFFKAKSRRGFLVLLFYSNNLEK